MTAASYVNTILYTGSSGTIDNNPGQDIGFNGLIAAGAAGTTLTLGPNASRITDGSVGGTPAFHDIFITGPQNVTVLANFSGNPANSSQLTYGGGALLTLGYSRREFRIRPERHERDRGELRRDQLADRQRPAAPCNSATAPAATTAMPSPPPPPPASPTTACCFTTFMGPRPTAASISGSGSLTATGGGILTLSSTSNSPYSGVTLISGGTLKTYGSSPARQR